MTYDSRRWPPRNQIHARRRRAKGNLQRRHAPAHPLARDPHHLRRARQAAQRRLPHGHKGPADGQHHLPRALAAARGSAPADLQDAGDRLRRARAAVDRQRGAQERRCAVQCEPVDYAA
jgi:hypothetical protein